MLFLTSSRSRATADQVIKLFHSLFNASRSKAIGALQRKYTKAVIRVIHLDKAVWEKYCRQIGFLAYGPYPIRAENGHPTMTPAATPIMANGVESWNHPVMATSVVYMQKEEGRKAEEKEQKRRMSQTHVTVSICSFCKESLNRTS